MPIIHIKWFFILSLKIFLISLSLFHIFRSYLKNIYILLFFNNFDNSSSIFNGLELFSWSDIVQQ